jgi:hypothetical protein
MPQHIVVVLGDNKHLLLLLWNNDVDGEDVVDAADDDEKEA